MFIESRRAADRNQQFQQRKTGAALIQKMTLQWWAREAIANCIRAVVGDRWAHQLAGILRAKGVARSQIESGFVDVLSYVPPIFVTSTVYGEFLGIAPAFGRKYGHLPAAFLIYPTSTINSESRCAGLFEIRQGSPEEISATFVGLPLQHGGGERPPH